MAVLSPDLVSLFLRVALGVVFIVHGWGKITDLKGTIKFAGSLGFWPAPFFGFMLAVSEFFGGIAVIAGFGTRVAASLILIVMLVAWYEDVFVWKKPFKGGWELELVLVAISVAVILLGAGAYGVDAYIGWSLG